jgi:ATP-binding cassette subfamily B protein
VATTTDTDAGLANTGALARLFAPIRTHLVIYAILSTLSATSGIVLHDPAAAAAAVWTWVGIGAVGAGGCRLAGFARRGRAG